MNNYIVYFMLLLVLCAMCIYTFKPKNVVFEKLKLYKNHVLVFGIILISTFSILTVTAKPESETLALGSFKQLQNNNFDEKIQNIALNKVVIVGDSRMEYIYNKKNELNIPNNFVFDAKSGAKIDWLLETGKPKLAEILDNRDTDYTYHVVFNLGVNDLSSLESPKVLADDYFKVYNEIISNYPGVEFYFLSVNPIDEDVINERFSSNKRTNKKIEEFNAEIYYDMNSIEENSINYCDAYNRLDFNLPDGLHYDSETDQRIIDYIARDCVNFK